MMSRIGLGFVGVLVLALILAQSIVGGWWGEHEEVGIVTPKATPRTVVEVRESLQETAKEKLGAGAKQILFGDFHVHTTFSADAFQLSLPFVGGEGTHPPADACDFARYCSALDFWSINDHAEGLTPAFWRDTIDSIRQCNAVAGDPSNPDMVAFMGWEWTQSGTSPSSHYGHKNIILEGLDDDQIPARPIESGASGVFGVPLFARLALGATQLDSRSHAYLNYLAETSAVESCPDGVPVRDLPLDCREKAETPGVLYEKLDDWGVPSLVIPHGTAWGMTALPGTAWDTQLTEENYNDNRQTLIEVFSGHGNSEVYRDFHTLITEADGTLTCPEPTDDFTPNCWRAGEIIKKACLEAGKSEDDCAQNEKDARLFHIAAKRSGFAVVEGSTVQDWLDAGQCKDCFLPAFNYRPRMSAQYTLARRGFDGEGKPLRGNRFGFLGSSDTHTARAGNGFKEFSRKGMTDSAGGHTPFPEKVSDPAPEASPIKERGGFNGRDTDRVTSFLYTGGLVATHAAGRDRQSIWQAVARREVYGTSGPRILLWFDLENGPAGSAPMGSDVAMADAPIFRVRAAGALKQKPGCPTHVSEALSADRLDLLCKGECYNPSDERNRIIRIEIIRIKPQNTPDEALASLIDDPWRVFPCDDTGDGCDVSFSDPEFVTGGRTTYYYARAIQEAEPTINGNNLRCTYDQDGNCIKVNPCYGDGRTDPKSNCLADVEHRAWSSPIFVDVADAL